MATLIRSFEMDVHGTAELVRGKDREILVTSGHRVLAQNLKDGEFRTVAAGYDMPAGVVATPQGDTLYVVDLDPAERQFTLYEVPVAKAGGRPRKGRAVLRAPGTPGQLALSGTTLHYADRDTGRLMSIDLERRTIAEVIGGLADPSGVAIDPSGKRILVAERAAGRIVSIAPGEDVPRVERIGIIAPQQITRDTKARTVLLSSAAEAGRIDTLHVPSGEVQPVATLSDADQPIAAYRVGRKLVTVSVHGIDWWDIIGKLRRGVQLHLADPKPFIGSYQRVTVDLGFSGLAFTDLSFVLPEGDAAGSISYSRDDLSGPNEIMLLVGYQPGTHKLEALDPSSAVVASVEFEITDQWMDDSASPAHWSVGELSSFQTGYTWGGGPSTPQNVNVFPQSGTRNICMLMVDVSDARYPTGTPLDTLRTTWQDGAVGAAPSARVYYEEVSHNSFTLALAGSTLPLVSLSDDWSHFFTPMSAPWPANSYAPIDGAAFAQACISNAAAQTDGSGNPLIDFSQVQSLILVIRSKGSASTDDFFWSQAWGGSFTIPGGSVNLNVLGMPDDWETVRDTRTIYETLSHELGHNLGYPDLYTNVPSWHYSTDVVSRDVTEWDLMSHEAELPHMSIAQKMECGWVQAGWVKTFDFSRSTIPLSQTVTLHAIEAGAPPSGQFSGVEIRIADGWNYYFEYRRGQSGQIGDQSLAANTADDTADGVVLGTDVLSQNFSYPIARPQIIRLRPDIEGEHSFFAVGQDYKETDHSSMAIADFKMSVQSISGNTATIKIEYGTNGRPDLYIRPWPGGTNWQSPDIEVRNARSMADPANWTNVPWAQHSNTVIARYRNRGPVTCTNVTVEFYVKDFTVSGAPEVLLGTDTHDVPPESSAGAVEFSVDWLPPDEGHRCIIARTPLYIDTSVNPNIVELSDSNNEAQSNYTRYISASASPASREIAEVTLNNPYDQRARIYVIPQIVGQFADFYRLYMEHSALTLDAGESKKVQVMVESMYGDPHLAGKLERAGEKLFYYPTIVSLAGYGIPPENLQVHPQILGGAQINVSSARATRFTEFGGEGKEGLLRGRVEVVATGGPASGFVLVTLHGPRESAANTVKVPLDAQGYFLLRGAQDLIKKLRAKEASAHYPGRYGLAPCDAPNRVPLT